MDEKWNSTEGFYFLKEQVYSGSMAFFFQKYTPWSSKFDYGLQNLLEMGLISKWYSDHMLVEVFTSDEQKSKPLSLYHLQGPFIVLIIGWLVAAVVFFLEIVLVQFSSCSQ